MIRPREQAELVRFQARAWTAVQMATIGQTAAVVARLLRACARTVVESGLHATPQVYGQIGQRGLVGKLMLLLLLLLLLHHKKRFQRRRLGQLIAALQLAFQIACPHTQRLRVVKSLVYLVHSTYLVQLVLI